MSNLRPSSYCGVVLRHADETDRDTLYRIFIASRDDLIAAVEGWGQQQRDAFLHTQFRAQQDQYRDHYPQARFDVIVFDGEIVGQLYVALTGDEIRLVDINLLPEFRNRGIGAALVRDLLDEATGLNLPVILHVTKGNPAVQLYRRLGFTSVEGQDVYKRMEWWPPSTLTTGLSADPPGAVS